MSYMCARHATRFSVLPIDQRRGAYERLFSIISDFVGQIQFRILSQCTQLFALPALLLALLLTQA